MCIVSAALLFPSFVYGGTGYYRHAYFDNSLTSDAYFYSSASAAMPSSLQQRNSKLPVETKIFITPPNALRLVWESQVGGGWQAEVQSVNFRNRFPEYLGSDLYFWCFAPQAIAAADLPLITLSNTHQGLQVAEFPGSFTESLPLSKFSGDLPAGRWVQIRILLSAFHSGSIYEFQAKYLQNIIFHQGRTDGAPHTLILDEIRIDDPTAAERAQEPLPAPQNVRAIGYDRHVEIRWSEVKSRRLARYVIYRSLDWKDFEPSGIQLPGTHRYEDFLGKTDVTPQYKVTA